MRPFPRSLLAIAVACGLVAQAGAQTTLPSVPEGFTARADGTSLTLSWRAPREGAPILYYVIELGIQPGVYEVTAPVGPITTLTIDIGEGTYYFRVSAVNALGQGPPTAELAITVGTGPPGPPEDVTATVDGTSVTLSWGPPATGSGVADYVASLSAGGVVLGTASVGLSTSITLTLPVEAYVFRVFARNAYGAGPTAEITFTVGTPVDLPGPPRNLAAAAVTGQLTFTWSPPEVGAPITGYIFEVGSTPGEYPIVVPLGPVTSYAVPGVGNGTYFFRVTAVNALGPGPPSEEAGVRTYGPQTPSVPRNISATSSESSLTITWAAPTFGAPITSYMLEIGIEPGTYIYRAPMGLLTTLSVPAVPVGAYFYRVTAANAYGLGTPSDEMSVVVGTPAELPGPPQNLGVLPGFLALTFAWSPPDTGAPITNYLFEAGSTSGSYSYAVMLGPVTSYRVSGVGGAGTLYFRVTAVNSLGRGAPSEEAGVNLSGPATPSAPRNLTASVTDGIVTLTWLPPTFGGPLTGYLIQLGASPGVYVGSGQVGVTTSLTLPPLGDGLRYLRVTGINAYGLGVPSTEVAVYTGPPCAIPAAPVLTGSVLGQTIALSWTTPAGGPVTGYSILLATQPGGAESTVATLGPVNSIDGLVTSGTYHLRVRAHALCGTGPRSNEVTLIVVP
jgi:hypothetical protein